MWAAGRERECQDEVVVFPEEGINPSPPGTHKLRERTNYGKARVVVFTGTHKLSYKEVIFPTHKPVLGEGVTYLKK